MSVFRVRKVAFINFGLLFIFLASWISWYMYPLVRSVTKEFSLEYGFAAADLHDVHLLVYPDRELHHQEGLSKHGCDYYQ